MWRDGVVVIEVEELTKRYGTTTAVDHLSFTVRPGQVTGFLGPNGAGKTTTLRMLLGLIEPSGGTATVGGRHFRRHPRGLRHVGALLDAGDVHGGRTARAHLASLARGNRIPRERVDEVLEEVGLAGAAAGRRVGGYSLGMRQRLGIATALLGDPPVLLFDEPLNGLDPEGVLWVRRLFRRLASEGRTVFVSSHLMSEMEHTADELVVIGRGRLIAAEPLKTFAARGTRTSVRVRTPDPGTLETVLVAEGAEVTSYADRNLGKGHNGLDEPTLTVTGISPERIGDLALQHRLPIHELTLQHASLEAAFMELTADSAEFLAGDHR
ncbi:bacitracin transport ATP-binding protein BcrA family protein [Streptomyces turgidiscabies Car8]|uniref:Bacitracin transport ATP-binding protein BcrA family protein n=1 Tax=Streptomyces turgidiscabies (strain Car8) TaxID=698760 RepID=L7F8X6_STRT8|nr:bacitracin transport ATP-binding protein BcrA family protein [Streptomyces turgidiscabies Car8]